MGYARELESLHQLPLQMADQRGGHFRVRQGAVSTRGARQTGEIHQGPKLVARCLGQHPTRDQHGTNKGLLPAATDAREFGIPELGIKARVVRDRGLIP